MVAVVVVVVACVVCRASRVAVGRVSRRGCSNREGASFVVLARPPTHPVRACSPLSPFGPSEVRVMSASALHASRFLSTASWMPLRWRVPSFSRFGMPRRMLLQERDHTRRQEEGEGQVRDVTWCTSCVTAGVRRRGCRCRRRVCLRNGACLAAVVLWY